MFKVISIKLFCHFIEITLRHGCSRRRSGDFIINLNIFHTFFSPSIADFGHDP